MLFDNLCLHSLFFCKHFPVTGKVNESILEIVKQKKMNCLVHLNSVLPILCVCDTLCFCLSDCLLDKQI